MRLFEYHMNDSNYLCNIMNCFRNIYILFNAGLSYWVVKKYSHHADEIFTKLN